MDEFQLLKEVNTNDNRIEIERLHHDIIYIKWTNTCMLCMMVLYMLMVQMVLPMLLNT